ncbi:MAG TPA: hypothetical protein VEO95_06140 [Chthoniobacteraceae bacterium]|nr:hypothetical protein [Chthoniobacteraceae bacterium]
MPPRLFFAYDGDALMLRPLVFIIAFSLSASAMHASTTSDKLRDEREKAGKAAQPKPRVRHVLFRSDLPKLIAPAPSKPIVPEPAPPRTARAKSRSAAPLAKSAAPIPAVPEPRVAPPATPPSIAPERGIEFQPTTFTPYDAYLGSVRAVISNLDTRGGSMVAACELMARGRSFRYLGSDP